jgi:group II intron reverse transcriptase/maturase
MVAQQLRFEFTGDRPSRSNGEAYGEEGSVYQVRAASERTEPIKSVVMEEVVRKENLTKALKRVCANKGSPGIDGMTVDELKDYLNGHWSEIREQLLEGHYTPQPVKQVLIPKPGGGTRMLGIPTVLDRFIQQALLQVLNPIYDPTFSPHSYGFRPRRNAHQAVRQAKKYIEEGYQWVVDIDLEQCFDRINHDILMGRIAKRISDKRILRLIRRYLQAGIMVHGVVQERYEGTPQGGPLSPLLSNILLDELDKELERRGHKFCRYADDCNIYVRSERAGKRVMDSVERFLDKKLKLKVNRRKSAVARPQGRGFLGFSFTSGKELKIKLSEKALKRVKCRIRQITRRSRGISLLQVIKELSEYLKGGVGYFGLIETPTVLKALDSWIRRRLRCFVMKQWMKNCHTRYKGLQALGVSEWNARPVAASRKGPWAMSNMKPVKVAMPNRFFAERGLLCLLNHYESLAKTI